MQRTLTVCAVLAFLVIAYFLLRSDIEALSPPAPVQALPSPVRPAPIERPDEVIAPPAPPAPVRVVETAPDPEPPAEPERVLPGLDESDEEVRERLREYGLPDLWIEQADLLRRFCVLVDNATRGELARRGLSFLEPEQPFRVLTREGRILADPRNGQRFDGLLDLLEAISPSRAAGFIVEFEPLLDEGMAALGSPRTARETLEEAVAQLRSAPEPIAGAELVRPKVLYVYADPALETLPPMDKQLLRLGTKNLRRLKAWLALFEEALARTSPGDVSSLP